MDRGRCFVSMPSGPRTLPSGAVVDFDALYREAIEPAIEELGLRPFRARSLVSTGTTSSAVIDAIAKADAVVVDVSSGDANVYYELGIRHALVPGPTLILAATGTVLFVDLQAGWPVLTYAVEGGVDTAELRARLVEALRVRLGSEANDSPVFELFPVRPLDLSGQPTPTFDRDRSDELRSRLVEARQMLPEDARPRLAAIEKDLGRYKIHDDRLSVDLMLAYRDCSAWQDVIRLAETFPQHLRDSAIVVQQTALARNRRGHPGDADQAAAELERFIDRFGPDSETFGLLGRIHKDRYQRTRDTRDLEAAVDAYRRGLRADPSDLYPGVNLVTLLTVMGGEAADEEVRAVLPGLRQVLGARMSSARLDYWDVATGLELAVIAKDWPAARGLVEEARARAAAPWMLESTGNNLRILADAMPDARALIAGLVRRLVPAEAVR